MPHSGSIASQARRLASFAAAKFFRLALLGIAVFLLAAPGAAWASQVNVTVTGVLTNDPSSDFDNYGNIFSNTGQDTDLSNQKFKLTFTVDDTIGTLDSEPETDYTEYYSYLLNTADATLTINGFSYTFSSLPVTSQSFDSVRETELADGIDPQTTFTLEDTYSNTNGNAQVYVSVPFADPALNPLVDFSWESPLTYKPAADDNATGNFVIIPNQADSYAAGNLIIQSIDVSGPSDEDGKNLGCPCAGLGGVGDNGGTQFAAAGPSSNLLVGNPVNAATGNKFQVEPDFYGAPFTGLSLVRYYNSADTTDTGFGVGWHSTWTRSLSPLGTSVVVTRADGRQDTFTASTGNNYTADPDVTSVLLKNASGWTLTLEDDSIETYNLTGQLISITARNGQVTKLAYTGTTLSTVTGPFGQKLTFAYTGTHVHTVTIPSGGIYTYAYDANNNLIQVTHPDATTRKYQYTNTSYINALTGLTDENGAAYAAWTYDTDGRAITSQHAGGADLTKITYTSDTSTTVTDADGNAHTYTVAPVFNVMRPVTVTGAPFPAAGGSAFGYDANGFINKLTDFDGHITTFVNNTRGQPTTEVDASGSPVARTITNTWLTTFHLPSKIVEPNRTTTFTYDAKGNTTNKTVTAGTLTRAWNYTYSATGQVLTAKNPDGDVTTYTYNAQGGIATLKDALGHTWSFTSYDANGRLLSMTDPNALVTTFTYDTMGRLLTRTEGTLKTTYKWNPAGMLAQVTFPDASFRAYTYDAAHRLTKVADTLADNKQYAYDAASNLLSVKTYNPSAVLERTASYLYDNGNRVKQVTGALATEITKYVYDAQGNLLTATDANNNVSTYTYDALNRMATFKDPTAKITTYTYDANDHVIQVADPRALLTKYTWNGLDEVTAISSPDTGASSATYFASGHVQKTTDARGDTATYVYDALERPKTITYSDGKVITYTYDTGTYGIGHLASVANAAGTTSYTYDQHGHILTKDQIGTSTTLKTFYGYDAFERLDAITYPSGKVVDYKYDTAGRVNGVTYGAANLVSAMTYYPFGMAASWTEANGTTYARSINQDGRIADVAVGGTVNAQAITFDVAGRITKLTETALAAKTYTYDQDDRLNGFEVGTAPVVYAYDVNGNRTSVKTGAGTITYTYPATSNRLSGLSGLVTQADTYDAAGNLLKDGTVTYTYDARGRMASAVASGLTTSYAVDGLGQRIGKSGTGVPAGGASAFDYDEAGHLLGEYTSTGVVIEETVWLPNGGRATPIAVLTGTGAGTIYSLSPDWLDAPHILQNSAKKAVWTWDHLGFGDNLPNSNPSGLGAFTYNLRFPGQYYDAESGLNYNMARDYNPNLGRYVESDPLGLLAGISTYGYAWSDPLRVIDPMGLSGVGDYLTPSQQQAILNNPYMQYIGDNPDYGYDAMTVGAALAAPGIPTALKYLGMLDSIPDTEGLPPDGIEPPVAGGRAACTAGPASRSSESGQSLYDPDGGEWRYSPEDDWHNPHWDYNPWTSWNSPWTRAPINGLPPLK